MTKGGTGRVREHRISRRGAAAQGHKESGGGNTVEETLNALLDEEASELVGAERYERAAGRETYRSGHYARRLITGAGELELIVSRLRAAAARTVRDGFDETLAYAEFTPEH